MITRQIEVKPSVEELALEFAHLPDDEQVKFLRIVASAFSAWGRLSDDTQLLTMGRLLLCDPDNAVARDWILRLAEWAGAPSLPIGTEQP